jgi:hypothetical protein
MDTTDDELYDANSLSDADEELSDIVTKPITLQQRIANFAKSNDMNVKEVEEDIIKYLNHVEECARDSYTPPPDGTLFYRRRMFR